MSYSHVGAHGVSLALLERVHETLAHADVAAVLLDALNQVLVERHAGVVLLLGTSHLLLLRSLLLHLLLLLGGLTLVTVAGATTHHGADGLVTDLGTGTKGHSGHNSTSHAGHHTLAGRSGLRSLHSRRALHGRSGGGRLSARAEHTTTSSGR